MKSFFFFFFATLGAAAAAADLSVSAWAGRKSTRTPPWRGS
jgi:hypothetical protein